MRKRTAGGLWVEFIYPPIPIRSFDYCAYRDFEGIIGWGETEKQAITDYYNLSGEENRNA